MKNRNYYIAQKDYDYKKLSESNNTFQSRKEFNIEAWTWEETRQEKTIYLLKAFRGKAGKHYIYYMYRTEGQRNESLEKEFTNAKSLMEYKVEQKLKNKGKKSEHALVSSIIKKELKLNFPGIKFSVRSETFAGGDAIRVGWTNGVTTERVEKVTNKYQGGYFDAMQDMYVYSNTKVVNEDGKIERLPDVKYISTSRKVTDDNVNEIMALIVERFGIENPEDTQEAWNKLGTDLRNYAYRIYRKIDFRANDWMEQLKENFTDVLNSIDYLITVTS